MSDELKTLRIGIIGAGFIANFHLESMISVRNVEVRGVFSRTAEKRDAFCNKANAMGLGPCTGFSSLEEMLGSGTVDAVWILVPNHVRLETMKTICDFAVANPGVLRAVACEKPLARNLREAKEMVSLVDVAGLNHGYLENQLFASAVERGQRIIWERAVPNAGRPYLARATEEHAGPHEPWFWQGDKQGGGALLDMMCHSVEVGRFLLSRPGEPRSALRLKSATGSVANLKWQRSKYATKLMQDMGKEVDYTKHPSEDFARGTVVFEDPEGNDVIVECANSWAFIGAGLRIELEVLGAEYSMEYNSLQSGLKVFMSRDVQGDQGEDMIEKQNSEQGLMPVMEDEHASYGYTSENRHMVDAFRKGEKPLATFNDGMEVIRILMGLYKSAELGRTIHFADEDLMDYVPVVARGKQS